MIVIDAHLDLAMNALLWNRDLSLSVFEIRQGEEGMTQKGRARGTVSFPQMREGKVAVSFATLIARVARKNSPASGYNSPEIAYAMAQGQLAYYRLLEAEGSVKIIKDWKTFESHLSQWLSQWQKSSAETSPLGFIISMEGADPIVSPSQVEPWWNDGLRIVSLSHYGVSAYAHGTGTEGGLTEKARPLLKEMEKVGMILDLTHLADQSFWEAIEIFDGSVLASHNNCRALVPGDRQFSDEQIKAIIERDGVIGSAMDAWMLYPNWVKGETHNSVVSLEAVIDQMDHICQLAGNSDHVAIGTDLDGGYGQEQCPHDLDTIVDLQKIPALLKKRGYSDVDVEKIMYGNWVRLLKRTWS